MIRHRPSRTRIELIGRGKLFLQSIVVSFAVILGLGNLHSCSAGEEIVLPYDLDMPSNEFALPPILNEASGLSWKLDGILVANQDEDGLVFSLDVASGDLIGQDTFWKPGDYEGIEIVGDTVWVVKSKGNLYAFPLHGSGEITDDTPGENNDDSPAEITDDTSKAFPTQVYKTSLKKVDNIETLAYDESRNCLWLVGKGNCYPDQGIIEGYKAWAFDLGSRTLSPEPLRVLLDPEDVKETTRGTEESQKDRSKQLKKSACPSGLAIHPSTREWYLLSSEQGSITVWDSSGAFLQRELFDKSLLPKAEGICFSPSGTLYIASEASKKNSAKVVTYSYQNKR